jgi:Asp/Glu/hydantoin racemase
VADRKRIFLLHPYFYSMAPVAKAFQETWPEAQVFNLLDESLYADIGPDGEVPAAVIGRIENILRHCVLSGADGVVFTGSTFGPALEQARKSIPVPVLRSDEGAAELAVKLGRKILILSTAARSLPVTRRSVDIAAEQSGARPDVTGRVVQGAKQAMDLGNLAEHNRLILQALDDIDDYDVVLFGQMSMEPALEDLGPKIASRVITTPKASAQKMRSVLT